MQRLYTQVLIIYYCCAGRTRDETCKLGRPNVGSYYLSNVALASRRYVREIRFRDSRVCDIIKRHHHHLPPPSSLPLSTALPPSLTAE